MITKSLAFLIACMFFTLPFVVLVDADAKGGGGHGGGKGGRRGGRGGNTSVHGYTKKDGTYVQPHNRTSPNSTQRDNYSSKGNMNPYTGKQGTVEPVR